MQSLNSKFYILHSRRSGQFLVEALIAISILTIGFMAVLALLNRSLALNRVAADNYTASYLAAEGIEVVKNLIDHNVILRIQDPATGPAWNAGLSDGCYQVSYEGLGTRVGAGVNCNPAVSEFLKFEPDPVNLYDYTGSVQTAFKRIVQIINDPTGSNPNEMKVVSIVVWKSLGGADYSVVLEDRFYNWRQ